MEGPRVHSRCLAFIPFKFWGQGGWGEGFFSFLFASQCVPQHNITMCSFSLPPIKTSRTPPQPLPPSTKKIKIITLQNPQPMHPSRKKKAQANLLTHPPNSKNTSPNTLPSPIQKLISSTSQTVHLLKPVLDCPPYFVHKKSCNSKFVIRGLYIGTGSDWTNLSGTAQFLSTHTDTTMFALIYTMVQYIPSMCQVSCDGNYCFPLKLGQLHGPPPPLSLPNKVQQAYCNNALKDNVVSISQQYSAFHPCDGLLVMKILFSLAAACVLLKTLKLCCITFLIVERTLSM